VESQLARDPQRATLITFIHPMCPCSKATAEELAHVMARCDGKVNVLVVAIQPAEAPQEWRDSALIRQFGAIPNVKLCEDRGGVETMRFGARTSGHTCLYDAAGRLLFSGGITSARGHEGDNAGSDAIVALVQNQHADQASTPVFGCSLVGEAAVKESGEQARVK